MRAVEMATKAKREAKEAASNGQKLDHQTRKKLMRAISSAEKKIEQIEKEIASIEKQMGEEGFYEKPDSAKTLEKYQQLKQDLEQAFEDWEEAQMELDEAEG
jgi:ATP-binding cassette subfamily F protein 3